MKWILLPTVVVACLTAQANAENATLVQDVKLPFGGGTITLNHGTVVEFQKTHGDFIVISFRNLRGQIARTALDIADEEPAGHLAWRTFDSATPAQASFRESLVTVLGPIKPIRARADALVIEGKIDEANQMLLDFFPADGRSAAQNFVIGNVLYKASPANSFVLHKTAAQQAPEVPEVLLEWALEQHRRKDYLRALATYHAYSRLQPDFAPVYGLAAECAVRTGNLPEALALYQTWEKSAKDKLEEFESLVCEVNGGIDSEGERAHLLTKVRKGEENAAKTLLLLDTTWRSDWWRASVEPKRLKRDLELIEGVFPQPGVDLKAMRCVAQLSLLGPDTLPTKKRESMVAADLLFDRQATLPRDGAVLFALFKIATEFAEVPSLRKTFGKRVRAMAEEAKDPETYSAAAFLYGGTDDLAEIEQEGWNDTRDARFAIARLYELYRDGKLSIDHPLVESPQKEFPSNSEIMWLAVKLAAEAKLPVETLLRIAIRSEYTKFSTGRGGTDAPHPSASALRGYFFELKKLHAADQGP